MKSLTLDRRNISAALLAWLMCIALSAQAQQATEQYIPIGQSPGVSGKLSFIGPIVAVDHAARTISVDDRGEMRVIKVTENTRIWLDRSKVRRENKSAEYDDCEVGRRIELRYLGDDKTSADWIKIESE